LNELALSEVLSKDEETMITEEIVDSVREIWRLGKAGTGSPKKDSITIEQFWVLRYISDQGPKRIKDIAAYIGTTSSPVTISVKRLEKMGLLTRERSKSDEREVTVHLTEHGKKVFEARQEDRRSVLASVFNPLDTKEKQQLNALLQKVLARSQDTVSAGQSKNNT
jgi:DNA-binding MarR family transcriptional regulator